MSRKSKMEKSMATVTQIATATKETPETVQDKIQPVPVEAKLETVTLSKNDLEEYVKRSVAQGIAEALGPAPARKKTNADFAAAQTGPGYQTQEDVAMLATMVGPVSHSKTFIPCVPEYVATKDLMEHQGVISQLQSMGYSVFLKGVEFSVLYQPADEKGVLIRGKAEPEAAKPLIKALQNLDCIYSRVWLERWAAGKALIGERQVEQAVANERRGIRPQAGAPNPVMVQYQKTLERAENRQFGAGDDNIEGIDMGSAKGAAGVETFALSQSR